MSTLLPDDGEYLTDGWESDLDAADSLVRQAVYAHASWATVQANCIDRPWHDGPDWAAGHCRDTGVMSNLVVLKRPPVDYEHLFAEINSFFPAGVPFLLVSAWPTPDLRRHGVALVGHPPLMWRAPAAVDEAPTTDLDIRWVRTPDELRNAERVLVEGYPLPELQPFRPGCVYDEPILAADTRVVVAYDGDVPLATAAAHSAHGVTLVEAVAVLPAARGRGAGAVVTWAATTAFLGQGAVLLASDDGQPVYARLGYQRVERWTAWLRST